MNTLLRRSFLRLSPRLWEPTHHWRQRGEGQEVAADRKRGSKEAGRFPAANLGPETSSLPVWLWDRHTFVFTSVRFPRDRRISDTQLGNVDAAGYGPRACVLYLLRPRRCLASVYSRQAFAQQQRLTGQLGSITLNQCPLRRKWCNARIYCPTDWKLEILERC